MGSSWRPAGLNNLAIQRELPVELENWCGAATSEADVAPSRTRTCDPGLEGRCSIQLSYGRNARTRRTSLASPPRSPFAEQSPTDVAEAQTARSR